MKKKELIHDLEEKALLIRRETIKMLVESGSGHPGPCLSAADILTVLYFHVLRIDPEKLYWDERDRFVLSKGHAAPILYTILAHRGYFPKEVLSTLRQINSILQGHPDMTKTPGIDMTSGSLGHGFSVSVGMALGGKLDKENFRVFVMLGDGECQEGLVWESAMAAAHYKLDNLIGIVDYNKLEYDGEISMIMEIAPLVDKWQSFGWHTRRINGHDMAEILDALNEAIAIRGRPAMIIADTIKGKGVHFMENDYKWHSIVEMKLLEEALKELGG
jgi:transketolase